MNEAVGAPALVVYLWFPDGATKPLTVVWYDVLLHQGLCRALRIVQGTGA